MGNHLVKSDPSFDPRLYGFSKLSNLVRAQGYLEVKQDHGSAGPTTLWVRLTTEPARSGGRRTARTPSAA